MMLYLHNEGNAAHLHVKAKAPRTLSAVTEEDKRDLQVYCTAATLKPCQHSGPRPAGGIAVAVVCA